MSAEKEVVNLWLNDRGFFTVSNIKVSGNKNIGILALKFKEGKIDKVRHVEVRCSITGSSDSQLMKDLKEFVNYRFLHEDVGKILRKKVGVVPKNLERVLVIGSLTKTKMDELKEDLKKREIKVFEFEDVLIDVLRNLDTQYYKNDVIRTLQLFKFLYLANPSKLANSLSSGNYILNLSKRQKFLKELLSEEDMKKGLRKSSEEDIMSILKHTSLKDPEKLAKVVESQLLNRRTRKPFLDALNKRRKVREVIKGDIKEEKLSRFF
ncbi:hypothetical protein ACFLZX_06220 [Nanoarchaeota archaeon]